MYAVCEIPLWGLMKVTRGVPESATKAMTLFVVLFPPFYISDIHKKARMWGHPHFSKQMLSSDFILFIFLYIYKKICALNDRCLNFQLASFDVDFAELTCTDPGSRSVVFFVSSVWDRTELLNNAFNFFCMCWGDKVALNVSTLPITGSSCRGARWAAAVTVEVTFMLCWANIFQVTFFNYTERQVPPAAHPPAPSNNHTSTLTHTHTYTSTHTRIHINVLTVSPFIATPARTFGV